jgi:hypothetical protein
VDNFEALLRQLEMEGFYGTVEIKFEAGRAVLLRKTETIKPSDDDHRNNRGILYGKRP